MAYSKLRLGHIRLLELEPFDQGRSNEPLRCRVLHRNLANSGNYIALSYPWGTSDKSEFVYVDGKQSRITPNLASALRYLSRNGDTRTCVWADAICINQNDNEEKDQQVPLMRAIYRSALVTVAWVPPGPPLSDNVEIIRDWITYATRHDTVIPQKSTLQYFLSSPYWRRVWILQELAISRHVNVVYGSSLFRLDELAILIKRLDRSSAERWHAISDAPLAKVGLQHLVNLFWLRDQTQHVSALRLVKVLEIAREAEATVPQDRIYGLWGLATDASLYLPDQSYDLSIPDLCMRLTKAHIDLTGSLNILPALSLRPKDSNAVSWAPDWFSKTTWQKLATPQQLIPSRVPGLKHKDHGSENYQGFQQWPYPVPWAAQGSTDAQYYFSGGHDCVLNARGRFLGTIRSCSAGSSEVNPVSQSRSTSSLDRPSYLSTPEQVWDALYYLLTLRHRENSFPFLQASTLLKSEMLAVIHRDNLKLAQSCQDIGKWWTDNSDFEIFGTPLSGAIERTARCYLSALELKLFLLASCTYRLQKVINPTSYAAGLPAIFQIVRFFNFIALVLSFGLLAMQLVLDVSCFCIVWYKVHIKQHELPGTSGSLHLLPLGMKLACGTFGIGWVHKGAQTEDSIVILKGCSVPLILRPSPQGGCWVLVGDAIVYGAMDGEMMDESKCEYISIR